MTGCERLLARQNADGGWGYQHGSSWIEPTVYALLALEAEDKADSQAARRGVEWLRVRQRPDGGWAPHPAVDQSTWVSALPVLLPEPLAAKLDRQRALAWVLAQTGRESSFWYRLRIRLLGIRVEDSQARDGWPWYPGAAAWVQPTALSILALEKEHRRRPNPKARDRAAEGRAFLLARRCRDGGWNHGSNRALGYDSDSYPETTGLALMALHGAQSAQVAAGVAAAERHLARCRSAVGVSWLAMGLLAQGRYPEALGVEPRDGVADLSLAVLAARALRGRNVFLD